MAGVVLAHPLWMAGLVARRLRSAWSHRAVRLAVALSVAMAVLGLRTASSQSSVKNDGKGIHYTATAVTMDAPLTSCLAMISTPSKNTA